MMEINDGYQINVLRSPGRYLRRLFISWAAVLGTLAIAGFLMKSSSDFSRGWFLYWALSACVLLVLSRLFIAWKIKRWARNGTMERRAVIVGGGPMQNCSFDHWNSSPTTISAFAEFSTIAMTSARRPSSRVIPNSAISMN